jgi:glycosyltransferase involved in cell wall biosynthesis
MRIGIDIGPVVRARTGVGHYCYYLIKHLLAQAPGDTFAGFSSGLGRPQTVDFGRQMPHVHLPVPTRALYAMWTAINAPKVDALLGGVDIFHATNYFLPPTTKARRVLTVYDLAFLVAPELASPRIVGPFSRNIRRFARQADAIVTCSEATKRDVVGLLGVQPDAVVVAYGAADEGFTPGPRDDARQRVAETTGVTRPYFLFVSTLEPRKNVPGLLRAFAEAAKRLPHDLVLVGRPGWQMAAIEQAFQDAGLPDRVHRVGYVPNHGSLADLYRGAEAFVFPSFYEGFGLPVLEAMACGCPVITADNSSLPEVGGDAALYCGATDVAGLAAAMERVATDEALRGGMVARGLAQAKRFSWEASARTTLDVYRRLA